MKPQLQLIITLAMLAACASASADGGKIKLTDNSQLEISSYLGEMANRCLKAYFPEPGYRFFGHAAICFTLQSDGSVSNLEVVKRYVVLRKASKMKIGDEALKCSVQNAAPFAKPPAALSCPVQLILEFSSGRVGLIVPKVEMYNSQIKDKEK